MEKRCSCSVSVSAAGSQALRTFFPHRPRTLKSIPRMVDDSLTPSSGVNHIGKRATKGPDATFEGVSSPVPALPVLVMQPLRTIHAAIDPKRIRS